MKLLSYILLCLTLLQGITFAAQNPEEQPSKPSGSPLQQEDEQSSKKQKIEAEDAAISHTLPSGEPEVDVGDADHHMSDAPAPEQGATIAAAASFSLLPPTEPGIPRKPTQEENYALLSALYHDDAQAVVAHLNQFPDDIQLEDFLTRAIYYKALTSFKEILKKIPADKIDVRFSGIMTVLHYACEHDNPVYVQLLIEHGADVNARNYKGVTPLMFAATSANPPIISLLLAHGARINDIDHNGYNALNHFITALENIPAVKLTDNQKETLRILLDNNIDITNKPCGDDPLIQAAENGAYEIVEALVQAGADIGVTNETGSTARDVAEDKLAEITANHITANHFSEAYNNYEIEAYAYKRIIQLLSNPLEYGPARQRIADQYFETTNQLPQALTDIIGEYLTGTTKANDVAINDIKHAIRTNNISQLRNLLTVHTNALTPIDAQLENSPLLLALYWNKPQVVELILKTMQENIQIISQHITQLKQQVEKAQQDKTIIFNEQGLPIQQEPQTPQQTQSLSVGDRIKMLMENLTLFYKDIDYDSLMNRLHIAQKQGNQALIKFYHSLLDVLIRKSQESIAEEHTLLATLTTNYNNQYEQARNQAVGNKEMSELLNKHTPESDAMDASQALPASAVAPIEALTILPNTFVQYLMVGDKAALEAIESEISFHPEYLNGVDNRHNNTPLMIAAEYGHDVIVETLLELGADRGIRNKAGQTALQIAQASLAIANEPARRTRLENIITMLQSQ